METAWTTLVTLMLIAGGWTQDPAPPDAEAQNQENEPRVVAGKVVKVSVYRGQALVTREVPVPEGNGLAELVVGSLPERVVGSSVAAESDEGIRVLSTRYRARAVREDTREEIRSLQRQLAALEAELLNQAAQRQVLTQDLELLTKLESFTQATTQSATDKANLNVEAVKELTDYIRTTRAEITAKQLEIEAKQKETNDAISFVRRQMDELAVGSTRDSREAVIVVDRGEAGAASVRLSYLVEAATWIPQYRIRSNDDAEPVRVEYLAAVEQQTGEDWNNVELTLSTALPQLSAVPPDLLALDVSFQPEGMMMGGMGGMGGGMGGMGAPGGMMGSGMALGFEQEGLERKQLAEQSMAKRSMAQQEMLADRAAQGGALMNEAAALEQAGELLAATKSEADQESQKPGGGVSTEVSSGATSVTYRLSGPRTLPSRPDPQLTEISRIDLPAEYYFKAVPVLSRQVFRLATLQNNSEYVFLPGPVRVYVGPDFVGRMDLPAVASGESFTVGFGADPQLMVERSLVESERSFQGGNQVRTYSYRIQLSSYRDRPITVQVWDRLPRAQPDTVAVSLTSVEPALSEDARYVRTDRPENLLRWDLEVEPGQNGEKAREIRYEFKLEYARTLRIESFRAAVPGVPSDGEPVPSEVAPPMPGPFQ